MVNTKDTCSLALFFFVGVGVANATTIGVTGFTQISGASFYDAPNNNVVASPTIEGVTVTPNPSFLNFSWAGGSPNPPDVPGDGLGFGAVVGGVNGVTPLTLDFSQPVAAFGATFAHSGSGGFSLPLPAEIQAFSGLDATGTLLGTVTDSGGNGPFEDFIGLWSSSLDIQSVVITSAPTSGYAVDGYAISLMPRFVPEPTSIVLLSVGLLSLAAVWRRRRPGGR